MRATDEQARTFGDFELPPLFGKRAGSLASPRRAGAWQDCVGCLFGDFEARRKDCVTSEICFCAWGGGTTGERRPSFGRRVPSEPTKYADGKSNGGDVREGAETDHAFARREAIKLIPNSTWIR